jgi:hypothetical protein
VDVLGVPISAKLRDSCQVSPDDGAVIGDSEYSMGCHESFDGCIKARERALIAETGGTIASRMLGNLANICYQQALDYSRSAFQERATRGNHEALKTLDGLFQANAKGAVLALSAMSAIRRPSTTFNFRTPSVEISAHLGPDRRASQDSIDRAAPIDIRSGGHRVPR